ncbi:helix-turn-helix domain-containing protein [Bacterioplanoides pacificum]|uniref:Helix-turn-helix domain-containing protein n=1 Tax=Bacterioplanoides pacificum TaxID=1171596 RepID=A0ABV7VNJ8_9GAMM
MNAEQTSYSAVLGVVLSNLRKERRIEQGEMAARMGLSQASYSRLESGKSAFSIDQMYQAASALGIDESEITTRLNSTVIQLNANGVRVVPQLRGNTTQAKQESSDVGNFIAGAALGGLLIGLLSRK